VLAVSSVIFVVVFGQPYRVVRSTSSRYSV